MTAFRRGPEGGGVRASSALALHLFVLGCGIPEPKRTEPPPHLLRFAFDPIVVSPGGPAWLHWEVEGAFDSLELELEGEAPFRPDTAAGAIEVRPQATLAATLRASGPGGAISSQTRLEVGEPQRVSIRSFEVVPSRVRPGESVRVAWETMNALQVGIGIRADGLLDTPLFDSLPASGARIFRPETSVGVELRAEGLGGPLHQSLEVDVGPAPPVIHAFRAEPSEPDPGRGVTLVWRTEAVETLRIDLREASGARTPLIERLNPEDEGRQSVPLEPGRHDFVLEVEGGGEQRTANTSAWIPVDEAPRVELFVVEPLRTGIGGEVDIRWRIARADAASLAVGGGRAAPIPLSGALQLAVDAVSTRVRLFATADGISVVEETSVEVDPLLPEVTAFGTSPSRSAPGEALTVSWAAAGAEGVRIYDDAGTIDLGLLPPTGFASIRPAGPVSLHLRAENARGSTPRRLPLRVGPRPLITRFEALDPEVRAERPVRWAYRIEGAETAILSMPGRTPVVLSDLEGILTLRRSSLEATPEGRIQASSALFTSTATAGFVRLPGAAGPYEEEPNDQLSVAHEALLPGTFEGRADPGDVDVLLIDVPPGHRPRVRYASGPDLRVQAVPLDGERAPRAWSERFDPVSSGQILEARLARMGPLGLFIETAGNSGAYRIDLELPVPACGDGVADAEEDCDDGNSQPGDGCSSTCAREDSDETEPNGEALVADPLRASTTRGFLQSDEEDWFTFDVGPGAAGTWSFLISDIDGLGCSADLRLALVEASGRERATDDGGGAGCPALRGAATYLEAGTWYLRLTPGSGRSLPPFGAYRLSSAGPP